MWAGFVFGFLAMFIVDKPLNLNVYISTIGLISILAGSLITLFTTGMQTICQKYVSETKAAIIMSTEAVFGTIAAIIILSEAISSRLIIGSIFILAGILVTEVKFSFLKIWRSNNESN